MKKYFLMMVVAVTALTMGVSSCSKDEEEEDTVEKALTGKYFNLDGKKSVFSFYKNHMVVCDGGASAVSGAMTGGISLFMGDWQIVGDKMTTRFTSGTYGGFDWNYILYDTVTLIEKGVYSVKFLDKEGMKHDLFNNKGKTFVDYTDDTVHDKALNGTWTISVYLNDQQRNVTMTIKGDGIVHFTMEDEKYDFDTNYSTKNGCVTFDNFILPNTGKKECLYIRETDNLTFYSTDTASRLWGWSIKK